MIYYPHQHQHLPTYVPIYLPNSSWDAPAIFPTSRPRPGENQNMNKEPKGR
jgi:hypothetical protein